MRQKNGGQKQVVRLGRPVPSGTRSAHTLRLPRAQSSSEEQVDGQFETRIPHIEIWKLGFVWDLRFGIRHFPFHPVNPVHPVKKRTRQDLQDQQDPAH